LCITNNTFPHTNSRKNFLWPETNVTFGTSKQIFISAFPFLKNSFIKEKFMFNYIRQTNHLPDKIYKYNFLHSHNKTLHCVSTDRGTQNWRYTHLACDVTYSCSQQISKTWVNKKAWPQNLGYSINLIQNAATFGNLTNAIASYSMKRLFIYLSQLCL
jgi:hypothetical protein